MRFRNTLLALFAVALLAACHHRADPDPALQYNPARMACRLSLVTNSSGDDSIRIDYDAQNRPNRITLLYPPHYEPVSALFTQLSYSGKNVQFQSYFNSQPDSSFGTAVIENGLVKQVFRHSLTGFSSGIYRTLDTLIATYNADGLPLRFERTVRYTNIATDSLLHYHQRMDFTVADGNVMQVDFTSSSNFVLSDYQPDLISIKYTYTGLEGTHRLLNTGDLRQLKTLEGYPLYLGKRLPSLMVTTNRSSDGSLITQQFAYSYELNDKGFPLVIRSNKLTSDSSPVLRHTDNYTYICP